MGGVAAFFRASDEGPLSERIHSPPPQLPRTLSLYLENSDRDIWVDFRPLALPFTTC